jgi:hypothetical protein
MKLGGHVQRGIQRAFWVNPDRALSTRELWQWTHPRETDCQDRRRRDNISRAIRMAAKKLALIPVHRIWPSKSPRSTPGGIVWRWRNTEEPAPTPSKMARPS